jgi:hypothetical protein
MMPPFMAEGFSGTLNLKHSEMKQALQCLVKEIAPILTQSDQEPLKQAWQNVLQAKSENLQKHGLVCSRFVPGGRSLLREYYDRKRKEADKDDSSL